MMHHGGTESTEKDFSDRLLEIFFYLDKEEKDAPKR
jgi:hypothetical protein